MNHDTNDFDEKVNRGEGLEEGECKMPGDGCIIPPDGGFTIEIQDAMGILYRIETIYKFHTFYKEYNPIFIQPANYFLAVLLLYLCLSYLSDTCESIKHDLK